MRHLLLLTILGLVACHTYPAPKWPAPWEEEMVKVCWDADHQVAPAKFCEKNPDGTDKNVHIEWPSLPLVVTGDALTGGTVMKAIAVWNEWLGFRAFKYDALGYNADIRIRYGGPEGPGGDKNLAGMTLFFKNQSKETYSMILIFNGWVAHPTTITHELGHALGLGHDPHNPRSIMFPSLSGQVIPYLEARDRMLLRRRYFNK